MSGDEKLLPVPAEPQAAAEIEVVPELRLEINCEAGAAAIILPLTNFDAETRAKLYILLRDVGTETPVAFGVAVTQQGQQVLQFVIGEPKRIAVASNVRGALRRATNNGKAN